MGAAGAAADTSIASVTADTTVSLAEVPGGPFVKSWKHNPDATIDADVRRVGYDAGWAETLNLRAAQLLGERVQFLPGAGDADDAGPPGHEGPRRRGPDPGRGAGDQDQLVGKRRAHRCSGSAPAGAAWARAVTVRVPIFSIRASSRSPGSTGPMPAGVPVAMTSPGSRVITFE